MKKTTLLTTLAFACLMANAQTHSHIDVTDPSPCGTTEATQKVFDQFPEFAVQDSIDQANFEIEYRNYIESWSPDDRSSYVVPIVVHVVHLEGSENITDEQIYDAIAHLNADFNKENDDLGFTIPEFAGITGANDIEFRLATKDPGGNCHSGITRTFSETTYDEGLVDGSHAIVEAVEDAQGNWPQNKYMNIFVCIDPSGNAGYTYRPGNWYPANKMYGSIFMRHDYMGGIGTSNAGRVHTLGHEAGHWFNLSHPWGNNNSPGNPASCDIDDGVDDTPNTIGWDNCSDLYGATCGSLDNVQNIMDYSYCSTMFTEGQAARVQTALLGSRAERYKLSAPSNLALTGVDGPGDLCEAIFTSNLRVVCDGGSIDFEDHSYHSVSSRSWTFEGGSPSTSTSETPTITYNTPGAYSVTLTVTNGGDSETITKEDYIVVLPEVGTSLPYKEGFESFTSFPDNDRFVMENDADDVAWELTDEYTYGGSKALVLKNFGVDNKSKDAIISGTIDLSDVDPDDDIIFNFKYAYERRYGSNDEYIRFFISDDCGETWALRKNLGGDDLGPEINAEEFFPSSIADWRQVNITTINSSYYTENFRFKIEFQNDLGNNIFIDNINLYPSAMASIEDSELDLGVKVYPHPLSDATTITLNAEAGETYNLILFNALGEQISTVYNGELSPGNNSIDWSTEDLAKGMYILRIEAANKVQSIKLIKD